MSVVIPVKDDAGPLRTCLALLARQTVAVFEIIVVDNGSADDSARVAVDGGAVVVPEPTPGIAAAASTGYDAARGEIIARLDADSAPPGDWIERVVAHFGADSTLGAVSGPGRFSELRGPARHVAHVLYMEAYFVLVGSALASWPVFGSNFAMRADVWRRIRHVVHREDPEVHDDIDLSAAVAWEHDVRLDRGLVVEISARPFGSIRSMWRRNRRAFHTLRLTRRDGSSVQRWRHRLARRRRSTRGHENGPG